MYSAKLSIPGKQNSELSYVFADELPEQENGSLMLFGMFDVTSTSEVYHTIIKETVKHFLDFYHSASPAKDFRSDDLPDSAEFMFENSIQYTYEKVTDALHLLQEKAGGKYAVDIKKIHCILGALVHDVLYLSITGTTIQPLLVYPVNHRNGPMQYMLMNIIESSGEQSMDPHARLFSQLLSGSVGIQGSSIMICNQSFLDYISTQQIKQTISNSRIDTVIPYFDHLLSKVHARHDFSALLISRDAIGPSRQPPHQQMSSAPSASMTGLNSTASSTQSILTPSMRPHVTHILQRVGLLLVAATRNTVRTVQKLIDFITAPKQKERYMSAYTVCSGVLTSLMHRLPSILPIVRSKAVTIHSAIRGGGIKNFLLKQWRRASQQSMRTYHFARDWFLSLNAISRALFILSSIFILLFLASLLSIQLNKSSKGRESRLKEILVAVEQKQLAADASLIYDDKDRARALLRESESLLALVDEKLKDRKEFIASRSAVEKLRMKVDNVTSIEQPTSLAALPAEIAADTSRDARMMATDDHVVVIHNDSIFLYNREAQTLDELPVHEKIPSISCAAKVSANELVFCNADVSRLSVLTLPDQTIRSHTLSRGSNNAPQKILLYNDRIYAFSNAEGVLVRYTKSGDAYGSGTRWIKASNPELANARDIAIDGRVYILTQQGALKVYRAGNDSTGTIPSETRDALTGASRIITNDDLSYLYALDREHKKIIIVDKESFALVGQITSPAFQRVTDFDVSKKRKTILVLDGGNLLSFPYEIK